MYVCIIKVLNLLRMKKLVLLRFILLPALFLVFGNSFSQKVDFNNYSVLKSTGEFPEVVIKALSLNNEETIYKGIANDSKKTAQQKKIFLMKNDCEIISLFRNGAMLFGDPLSLYVNKVAAELLKDNTDLLSELNFFVLKNPAVNAFSNNNGFIFVNIGLLANLETESELAFVIAHEISHYIRKHPMEAHLENLKIIKGKSAYRFKSNNQKLDLMGKRSREFEFEADSIGISLFLASSYNPETIDKSLDHLHYSYIPFSDIAFNTHFFNNGDFVVPSCYFIDTCAKKTAIKDTYDENYSHPNIFKRKAHANKILTTKKLNAGSDYLVSQSEFNYVREIARFELVHLNVRNEEYGDAIYNAYALLNQYPDNKYLEFNIAKSLYGLTKYKNEDKYFQVAESYEKAEGESQQVHFFLKQLNRKQLNTLSINYIQKIRKKYPDASFLDKLETDLINELITKNDIDVEKLNASLKAEKAEEPAPSLSKRELQKRTENFYYQAFNDEALQDTSFMRKFTDAKARKTVTDRKEILSAKEKLEAEKKLLELLRANGLHVKYDSLIVLDPYLEIDRNNIEDEYPLYDKNKGAFDQKIVESTASAGLTMLLLSSREIITANDISKYNQLCMYREMFSENMTHDIDNFYPIGAEYFSDTKPGLKNIMCYAGLYDGIPDDQYFITYIDLNTGETLYWNEKKIQKGNFDKAKKYLIEDLHVLTQ
jgi:beta-barrel assembly-enhancing protease